MMAKRSRILIGIAALALGLMYALPVWTIELEAPQYPEGIGMVIRLNTIEGQKQHDLNNINNLNHYIGMQRIEPESIPELRWMPIIVAVLMASGLLTAALGRRRLLYAWTIGFLTISALGLADFWKWEYDYGHNLDPTAAIQVPGMSYQPPLIGSRQILNFTAHSWPGSGGWIAILVAITAVAVSWSERRRAKSGRIARGAGVVGGPDDSSTTAGAGPAVTAAVLALLVVGCGEPEPRALVAGVDGCADCLMVLDAGGHGAELVATTGRIYTFDSAECLINYLAGSDAPAAHSLWVTDFANPDDLVRAEEAYYLVSQTLTSPMGLGVTAFAREVDRDGAVNAFGGEPMDWSGAQRHVSAAWPEGRPEADRHPHGGHAETLMPAG